MSGGLLRAKWFELMKTNIDLSVYTKNRNFRLYNTLQNTEICASSARHEQPSRPNTYRRRVYLSRDETTMDTSKIAMDQLNGDDTSGNNVDVCCQIVLTLDYAN